MQRWIIEQHIASYRRILAEEMSEERRMLIENLLADEEAKLAKLRPSPPASC
jgi:hypothetical protein